ncbi:MAG: SDR family oxidoreductase [Nitrospinota bacterium]|nr:MAG: SDR family oxidoreductase [Nitrospinota bacterium]
MRAQHAKKHSPWQTVLITGASSGIGEALAYALAVPNRQIALVARRKERLEKVAQAIRDRGGEPLVLACDVGDPRAVQEAASRLRQTLGTIDIAFLNAGIGSRGIAQNLTSAEAEQVMRVNYLGVVYWLDQLLPDMQKHNRGTIVVTSSLAAYRALPGCGTYCAAKSAVSALIESYQIDLLATNVHLVLVTPYFVETEMTGFDPYRSRRVWMSAADAAQRILQGVEAGKHHIAFPWHFRCFMTGLSLLPLPLYRMFWRLVRRGG